jgi:putative Mg2+ transporter-C (MgtC) family protein
VIGILFGIGFFFPAILSTLLALVILTVFRWIEYRMPAQSYAHFQISFDRNNLMPEAQLRALLAQHHFSVANMSYRIANDGSRFEYRMMIRTSDPRNPPALAGALAQLPVVREFRISPTGDRSHPRIVSTWFTPIFHRVLYFGISCARHLRKQQLAFLHSCALW